MTLTTTLQKWPCPSKQRSLPASQSDRYAMPDVVHDVCPAWPALFRFVCILSKVLWHLQRHVSYTKHSPWRTSWPWCSVCEPVCIAVCRWYWHLCCSTQCALHHWKWDSACRLVCSVVCSLTLRSMPYQIFFHNLCMTSNFTCYAADMQSRVLILKHLWWLHMQTISVGSGMLYVITESLVKERQLPRTRCTHSGHVAPDACLSLTKLFLITLQQPYQTATWICAKMYNKR